MSEIEVILRVDDATGRAIRIGTIAGTRSARARSVLVRRPDGAEEKVGLTRSHRIVPNRSARLTWLLDPDALRGRMSKDPVGVFLAVIRDAVGDPVSTIAIKKTLTGIGLEKSAVDSAWAGARKRITEDEHVVPKGGSYAWTDQPRDPYQHLRALPPADAFEHYLRPRVPVPQRAVLAEVIRAALTGTGPGASTSDGLLASTAPVGSREDGIVAARRRAELEWLARKPVIDTLADLAAEIEERAANGAGADVLIERARAIAQDQGLAPIGQAGLVTSFDRRQHEPIIGPIPDGVRVTVVRPGYTWHTGPEAVLVSKAKVIDDD